MILGISGMLGNAIFRYFSEQGQHIVWGTLRNKNTLSHFDDAWYTNILSDVDVLDQDTLRILFNHINPDYVINCIGLVKQLAEVDDPLITLPINSILPHQLAKLCSCNGARLLQISTDCVFSGRKGNYTEEDISDAIDLYGKSKFIGELQYPHTLTIRTSIIGHELESKHSLVDWFLSQQTSCQGYTKAIFSGFPTIVLAQIIHDYILTHPELSGVYHVASNPISKFNLLSLIASVYCKPIQLLENATVVVDRTLNASCFNRAVGYVPPEWTALINDMHNDYQKLRKQHV